MFRHLVESIAASQKLILQQFGTLTTLVGPAEGPEGTSGGDKLGKERRPQAAPAIVGQWPCRLQIPPLHPSP